MERIYETDKMILLYLQEHIRNSILTPAMKVITSLGNAGMIWIILTAVLLLYKPTRRLGLLCLVALAEEYIVCDLIIKKLVRRARPFDQFKEIVPLVRKPTDYSFPSGHSGSSFAVGFTVWRKGDRRLGIPALLLAFLIAFSRLYVAVHYPSDVFTGILLGILFSFAGEKTVVFLEHRVDKSSVCPKDSKAD